MFSMPSKVLALSPHIDDVEIGCGGLLSLFSRHAVSVRILSFSYSDDSLPRGFTRSHLKDEAHAARDHLGLGPECSVFLDFVTRDFANCRQEILQEIVNFSKTFEADLVLLPSTRDTHQDHQVISQEGARAFKSSMKLGYQIPWNLSILANNCKIRLSESDWQNKLNAISVFESQLQKKRFDVNSVDTTGRFFGEDGGPVESYEFVGSVYAQDV